MHSLYNLHKKHSCFLISYIELAREIRHIPHTFTVSWAIEVGPKRARVVPVKMQQPPKQRDRLEEQAKMDRRILGLQEEISSGDERSETDRQISALVIWPQQSEKARRDETRSEQRKACKSIYLSIDSDCVRETCRRSHRHTHRKKNTEHSHSLLLKNASLPCRKAHMYNHFDIHFIIT